MVNTDNFDGAWQLSAHELAFREEVRDFLQRELPSDLREAGRRCSGIFSDYADGIRWHRILARRGWSVPKWPVEHGGTGWTPRQHYIFATEMAAADAPPLAPIGARCPRSRGEPCRCNWMTWPRSMRPSNRPQASL